MYDVVELLGYAKVNLALGISGVSNGFHDLDTVMATVDICDKVTMRKRTDDVVSITYLDGRIYESDNAYRTAVAVKERYNLTGVDIIISKNVPEGVGLGGSAVDGACIVRGYEKLFGIKIDDNEFLVGLGGDLPFLKVGGTKIVKGRGEIIIPIELPTIYLTLAYSQKAVSTKEVFCLYDKIGGDCGKITDFLTNYIPFNALEKSAVVVENDILKGRKLLEEAGFTYVVMTGSGNGYIGYEFSLGEYEKKAKKAMELEEKYGLITRNLKIIKEL